MGLPEQTLSQRVESGEALCILLGTNSISSSRITQWPRNLYYGFQCFPPLQACSINCHFYEFKCSVEAELHLAPTAVERTKEGGWLEKGKGVSHPACQGLDRGRKTQQAWRMPVWDQVTPHPGIGSWGLPSAFMYTRLGGGGGGGGISLPLQIL